jgi:hypothetical protein
LAPSILLPLLNSVFFSKRFPNKKDNATKI